MERLFRRRQSSLTPVAALPSAALLLGLPVLLMQTTALRAQSLPSQLPDAPSALLAQAQAAQAAPSAPPAPSPSVHGRLPPCKDFHFTPVPGADASQRPVQPPCEEENPLQPIVTSSRARQLTVADKGVLAFRDVIDPFNLITIAGSSAVTVAANSHTAYGPGFTGFAELTGYSLTEDIIGETLATFAIPSLVHEDPRYHRMPGRPFGRRLLHAVAHTFVSQHDDGSPMPNYAILLTYPLAAEAFNLYVPGVATDAPSTAERIAEGIATNPAGDIIAEFLPDIARRVHVRIVFVQQIMNQIAIGQPGTM